VLSGRQSATNYSGVRGERKGRDSGGGEAINPRYQQRTLAEGLLAEEVRGHGNPGRRKRVNLGRCLMRRRPEPNIQPSAARDENEPKVYILGRLGCYSLRIPPG
jgi:hypothetical protein